MGEVYKWCSDSIIKWLRIKPLTELLLIYTTALLKTGGRGGGGVEYMFIYAISIIICIIIMCGSVSIVIGCCSSRSGGSVESSITNRGRIFGLS